MINYYFTYDIYNPNSVITQVQGFNVSYITFEDLEIDKIEHNVSNKELYEVIEDIKLWRKSCNENYNKLLLSEDIDKALFDLTGKLLAKEFYKLYLQEYLSSVHLYEDTDYNYFYKNITDDTLILLVDKPKSL